MPANRQPGTRRAVDANRARGPSRRRWTDRRPILFFDSGVGGLSVLAPTAALLPRAPLIYVADSAGFPYGTRGEAEIAARVPALLGRLGRTL